MKNLLKTGAILTACALLIGVGIGFFVTRTPTMETAEAKTATPNQPITVTMQFPMGIAK